MIREEKQTRMKRQQSIVLHQFVGACPACSLSETHALGFVQASGVVYRRSHMSVTLRCRTCALQWTMTWDKIHKAATHYAQHTKNAEVKWLADAIAEGTRHKSELHGAAALKSRS